MKKSLIAMLIAFSFAVVSCGGTKEEATEEAVEVVETEVEVEADTTVVVEEVAETEVEG
jgi:hypothetical protein